MLDLAIIGGGPAGLTAGLYAVRGGANVRLYEELFAGGQIVKTHQIDNYPGVSNGPDGYALAAMFEEHTAKFGLPIVALTGPTHAEEVARKMPTVIVAASSSQKAAEAVRAFFSCDYLRVYTSPDIRGAELCGALKNVIALASGNRSG